MECLLTDGHRECWITAPVARRVADELEHDRSRTRTHHVSNVVAAGNRHVIHCASDPDVIRTLIRHVLER